jgi:DNA-binding MarR family transcriptional regulator
MSTVTPRKLRTAAPGQQGTLGFLLRELYDALQREVYAAVAADGHPHIRDVHSPVLRYLTPDGARVSDIARRCGYAKQSIAYLVDDLARLGYVTIEPDTEDRRAKRVRLTARGDHLIARLLAHSREAERSLAKRIGTRKVATLRSALAAAGDRSRPNSQPQRRQPVRR